MSKRSNRRRLIQQNAHKQNNQEHSTADHDKPAPDVGNAARMPNESPIRQPNPEDKQHQAAEEAFRDRQLWESRLLNIITGTGSAVALGALIVLFFTLRDGEWATEQANRAWIAPRGIVLDAQHSSTAAYAVTLDFDDVGREPARDVNIGEYMGVFDAPANIDIDNTTFPIPPIDTCALATNYIGPVYPSSNGQHEIFFDKRIMGDLSSIIGGQKTLYIKGCFKYLTFGRTHWSAFCYYSKPIEVTNAGQNKLFNPDGSLQQNATGNLQLFFLNCPNHDMSFAN